MDNKDSMLKEVLTKTFNEIKFNQFITNLLNLDMKERISGRPIVEKSSVYENHIEYVKDIGKYTDENRKNIVASIVKLRCKPDQARTLQRNFIAKHLKDINADAAIVALYSDDSDIWRISFVKLDYTFDINGLTENITPAKRYSYLIEPKLKNHTVQEQLKKLLFNDSKKPSVEEIENVFSVEVVTDEFFKMYRDKYLDLKEFLESNSGFIEEAKRLMVEVNEFSEEFAKKLMGQVAFLYFLQKKGWLGVPIVPFFPIDRNELREIYKKQNEDIRNTIAKVYNAYKEDESKMELDRKILNTLTDEEADGFASAFTNTKYDQEWGNGKKTFIRDIYTSYKTYSDEGNFFNSYLEPLFYEALNSKRGNHEYYKRFNCKIPFLNGGLFEPIYKYEWKKINIEIPDEFFSNDDNDGLLDFFDMYNFTMNEDEPLEKEVAVDPEMLGKIFENLLDVKERKSKGAFYTPREIVHYMCQECLINYLNNETKIDTTSLELLIKYGEVIKDADLNIKDKDKYKMPKYIIDNLDIIDKALECVTVADPAVGSGAFPLGMLNEIVKARNVITDYMTKDLTEWQKEDFINDNKRSLYDLKKNAMKKSIFAVDIEPSAIDITKLRLWLSLVVDADIKTVNTLPNLDYNIMVGNSLIDEFKGIKLFDEELLTEKAKRKKKDITNQISMNIEGSSVNIGIEQEYQLLEDIQSLQSKLFDIKETSEKIKIKRDIENKEWELIEYKLNREKGMSFKEVEEFKKQKKSNRRPYFLWKLEFSKIFKEKGGFDIVIGNPPYVRQESITDVKDTLKKIYKVYSARADLYVYFYELSYNLLRKSGNSSFITSNKWMRNKYGQKIREFIKENTNIIQLIDFAGFKVFDTATVDTNILTFRKNISSNNNFSVCNISEDFNKNINIKKYLIDNEIRYNQYEIDCNCFSFQNQEVMNIKTKVESVGVKLKDWNISIRSGFKTGLNEAFIIDKYTKEELCELDSKSIEVLRKNLRGKDVRKYHCEWNDLWIIMAKYGFHKEIDNYPAIKDYLYKYEDKLKARGQCKYSRGKSTSIDKDGIIGQHHWLELDNNPKEEQINAFKSIPKILYPDIAKGPSFYYDREGYFSQETCFCIVGEELKYLVGVLNTKAITYIYQNFYAGGGLGNKGIRYKKAFIEQLPIPVPTKDIKRKIEEKVDEILSKKYNENSKSIQNIEDEINELVCDLYGFTNVEKDIINQYEI